MDMDTLMDKSDDQQKGLAEWIWTNWTILFSNQIQKIQFSQMNQKSQPLVISVDTLVATY